MISAKKYIKSFFNFAAAFGVLAAAGFSIPEAVLADDTEVFFPNSQVTTDAGSTINPNILFVIDTSGSMADDDGFKDANGNPLSRLRRVQLAFRQLIQSFPSTVNVGLERFSDSQGGPILFPVSPIDSKIGGVISLDYVDTNGGPNEAEERLNDQSVRFPGPGTTPCTTGIFALRLGRDRNKIYQQCGNRDEAEEWDQGLNAGVTIGNLVISLSPNNARGLTDTAASDTGARCSADLTLTKDPAVPLLFNGCFGLTFLNPLGLTAPKPGNQEVGLRFPGVDIPSSASIQYASLTLTDNGLYSANTSAVNIYGHLSTASSSFNQSVSVADVSSRPRTSNSYPWTLSPVAAQQPFFSATPTSTSPNSYATNTGSGSNLNLKDVISEIIHQSGWGNGDKPITLLLSNCSNYGASDKCGSAGGSAGTRAAYGIYGGGGASPKQTTVNNRPKLAIVTDQSGNELMTAVRFENIQIPRGAVVESAYIEFHAAETIDPDPLTLEITAQASGDSAALATNNANLSATIGTGARPRTAALNTGTSSSPKDWDVPVWGVPYGSYSTPNLKPLVDEVTKADGAWCGGNSMTFFFKYKSGTGARYAVTNALNPSLAPVLHLKINTGQDAYTNGCVKQNNITTTMSSTDDAEQANNSTVSTASNPLKLGCSSVSSGCPAVGSSGSNSTLVGVRFPAAGVMKGSTINSATITFTAQNSDSSTSSLLIRGENTSSSAAFKSTNNNIGLRKAGSSTSSTISWNPGAWTTNSTYSVDVKTIVQELVNRSDWTQASAMSFIFEGTGRRRAYSQDGGKASAVPILTIGFSGGTGGTSSQTVRQTLADLVDSFTPTGYTPTVGALYEAARYFRGEAAYYGRTRGAGYAIDRSNEPPSNADLMNVSSDRAMVDGTPPHSLPTNCTTDNLKSESCSSEAWTGGDVYYKSPITDGCQGNNIILLSDGFPNNTATSDGITTAKANVQAMIGKSCASYKNSAGVTQSDWACGPDIAAFMHTVDQAPDAAVSGAPTRPVLTGPQLINTYTIGFGGDVNGGADTNGKEFLQKIATAGGGYYEGASSTQDLVDTIQAILNSIKNYNSSFVAPAVTVNSFNRLTNRNELYFAVFKTSIRVDWRGNLKRYVLMQPDANSQAQIYDSTPPPNARLAIDTTTGYFSDRACSFWSDCTSGPDGNDTPLGGAAGKLTATRKVYTYVSNTPPSEVDLSGSNNYLLSENNSLITKSLLGIPTGTTGAEIAASDDLRSNALQWARGIDVDGGGGVRKELGDPLHSEPVLITYDVAYGANGVPDPNGAPDISIFMGTNDGQLHAFDARTGTEQFAFVPQALLSNIPVYYKDQDSYVSRPYGLDGPLTAWVNDANRNGRLMTNGSLEAGDFAYLYAGMRRGGRNYYAFDVTNRSAPKLKFQITGGVGDFVELGQTWSRAVKARLRYNKQTRDVLIFTGGYDPVVDQQNGSAVTSTAISMGRALYVADAKTGALVWWAGYDDVGRTVHPTVSVPNMTYSVAASPNVVDVDGDGYVDRIYIADTGGQVFRFVLGADTSDTSTSKNLPSLSNVTVNRIAHLSGNTVASAHRFYSMPDVAYVTTGTANPYFSINLGSGYREHPRLTENEDRFYVLRDPDVTSTGLSTFDYTETGDGTATNPGLYDATQNYIGKTCATGDAACASNKAAASAALASPGTSGAKGGFYIRLIDANDGSLKGEKVIAEATTFNGSILFSTYLPTTATPSDLCKANLGDGYVYVINILDGQPSRDMDANNVLTASDRSVKLAHGGLPPNPVILFVGATSIATTDPLNPPPPPPKCAAALVCTGTECLDLAGCVPTIKTGWQKIEN